MLATSSIGRWCPVLIEAAIFTRAEREDSRAASRMENVPKVMSLLFLVDQRVIRPAVWAARYGVPVNLVSHKPASSTIVARHHWNGVKIRLPFIEPGAAFDFI